MRFASMIRCAVVTLAMLFCGSAFAQENVDQPVPEKHTGFFLQGGTGLGYISSSYDGSSVDVSLHGMSALFNLGVGYSVVPGLALHGSVYGGIVMSPTLTIDGDDIDTDDDVSLNMVGFGAGITYHTPINLYFSGSAGVGLVSLETDDDDASLEPGLSLMAKVGYEWSLTHQLGLGVAGQFIYFRNAERDVEGNWTSLGGGPVVSMTFN